MDPPVGVPYADVDFSWRMADGRPGARQGSYRILVATRATTDPASPAVVWNSGAVASAAAVHVPYAGPALRPDTDYWWTVSTADAAGTAGPFAGPQHFVTDALTAGGPALWVRPGPADPQGEEYSYVRKAVRLGPSPVVRATAYVAAAHKYQLWVNGRLVDSGPSFSYPDESYEQATDVTRFVHAGRTNVVGILHHWYGAGQGRPESAPGLLVQMTVVHADGTRDTVTSDGTWRQHAAEWLPAPLRNDEGDHVERVDGRATPIGWSTASFDDSTWSPVPVIGPIGTAPFTGLTVERTRIAEQPVRPVRVRRLKDGAIVADLGAVVAATPTVTFRHGTAGRAVKMHVGFLLDPDGHVSTTRATQGTDLGYEYTERAGPQTFRPYGYLAFRYLEVDGAGEALGPAQMTAIARHSAMPAASGSTATFHSSNPTLDAVWRLVQHSALYSAQEQFLDTPTREKGQFLADAYDESLATMRGFGEQNLTRQALLDFAHSQARYWPDGRVNAVYPNGDGKRDIPDYTLMYPEWVLDYAVHTGDLETVRQVLPTVEHIADYVTRAIDPATGLVTLLPGGDGDYQYGIVDWPPLMRYGYDMKTVARTTVNVLAVEAFDALRSLALLGGDPALAATIGPRAVVLQHAIEQRLRRPDGVFVDGLEADGSQSPHASQQANAFALAAFAGGNAADRLSAPAQLVSDLGIATGPMNGLTLLRALHTVGRDADLLRVLTDRTHPGWAYIVASGGTFTWESWRPLDVEGDSMSHGWGSSALAAFQEDVLGVVVDAAPTGSPERVTVAAPTAGPAAATGSVPTPAGPVRVEWRRVGGSLSLRLTVPPDAEARVVAPGPGRPTVTAGAGTHAYRFRTGA
jgi:alpha-L-rhamnosidase